MDEKCMLTKDDVINIILEDLKNNGLIAAYLTSQSDSPPPEENLSQTPRPWQDPSEYPGAFYHVMNRGNTGQDLFTQLP